MDTVKIVVEALVSPTESDMKVQTAIKHVFGAIPIQHTSVLGQTRLVAQGQGLIWLEKLRDLIRKERIQNAARRILLKSIHHQMLCFSLNKQVAYIGRLSFSEEVGESTLGPITIRLEGVDPQKLVDWLAPKFA